MAGIGVAVAVIGGPAFADPAASSPPPPSSGPPTRYYPQGAQDAGREGIVEIKCKVTVKGELKDCVVLNEDPPNLGFGAAAIRISAYFKVKPKTVDGRPVDGGTFQTRVRFKLDDAPPASAAPAANP